MPSGFMWPKFQVWTIVILPSCPLFMMAMAFWKCSALRCMVPACTTRLYLRAASTICLAFIDGDGNRLLHVDVFARFAGFDRQIRMPVIRRRNANCVNRFVFQNLAEVLYRFWLAAGHLHGQIEAGLIDVADGGDFHFRLLHGEMQIGAAHATDSDKSDADFVVGRLKRTGEQRTGDGGGRAGLL